MLLCDFTYRWLVELTRENGDKASALTLQYFLQGMFSFEVHEIFVCIFFWRRLARGPNISRTIHNMIINVSQYSSNLDLL